MVIMLTLTYLFFHYFYVLDESDELRWKQYNYEAGGITDNQRSVTADVRCNYCGVTAMVLE